ncbi:flippase-like domain-containing protein [Jatrophihabitans telluris]|uniref:Flippase-like domain-containing protein n=1 Tax=Jatrophihabitans telluris TaxID=2038343 RepID=A0ABY4R1C0_9ACTN|nr:lysylphosphatidylglycerol synthase domain-containing protein [Jatrophihabitans telluris]UQX89398.1 flippase-like domain-containing protein [Jatrophihabitans telluris]
MGAALRPSLPVRWSFPRRWLSLLSGAAVTTGLFLILGPAPFLDGLARITPTCLVVAGLIAIVSTVAAAWRWAVIARALGLQLGLSTAVLACYRSQLLNTILPGGVLGDVHRGLSHGQSQHNRARGLQAVFWERTSGQVVQLGLAVLALLVLPSPLRRWWVLVALGVAVLAMVVVLTALRRRTDPSGFRWWPAVLFGSSIAVIGHVATFLLAARTAGVQRPWFELVPLAMLVLVAMAIPANVAGWGAREGAAASVFAAAGLPAAAGVATATVYGVMVAVAALPGAAVLLTGIARRPEPERATAPETEPAADRERVREEVSVRG